MILKVVLFNDFYLNNYFTFIKNKKIIIIIKKIKILINMKRLFIFNNGKNG